MRTRPIFRIAALVLFAALCALIVQKTPWDGAGRPATVHADRLAQFTTRGGIEVREAVVHDTSPPLRDIVPARGGHPNVEERDRAEPAGTEYAGDSPSQHEEESREGAGLNSAQSQAPSRADLALQARYSPNAMPPLSRNFEGLRYLPGGNYMEVPDPDGDVGPSHYVQIVNVSYAVFSKTSGMAIHGPHPTKSIWTGMGGGGHACETYSGGDGLVRYDRLAGRWVISQMSKELGATNYFFQCVAVSTSGDPTGTYHRYAFGPYWPKHDYPKMGLWPDGYYFSYNMPPSSVVKVCAMERDAMLVGAAATEQCIDTSVTEFTLLPSDLDGPTPPPLGSPNYLVSLGDQATGTLQFWKFHVDWDTPSNSSLTQGPDIDVDSFVHQDNVPQKEPGIPLIAHGSKLMNRLAYRNLGDHASLVASHAVASQIPEVGGVRWYELRLTPPDATVPTVNQQGTYAPDGFRWMSSAAMDQEGNMAVGFSVSSPTIHPQIHYAGRLAGDPPGDLTQGESTIVDGTGSQTANWWGDYTSMNIDPADDCTFWYTNQYLTTNGINNWRTRIAAFKYPSCGP